MLTRRTMTAGLLAAASWPRMALAAPRVFRAAVALEGSRLLMAVGLDGHGPYIFLIDTGAAASLIRDDLAQELKLPVTSRTPFGGLGGHDIYPVYQARDVVFGGSLRQQNVAFVGAGNLSYGRDVRGALAAGMLTAMNSLIDFDAGELRLYPDGPPDLSGFTELSGSLDHGRNGTSSYLFAMVRVNGRPLRLLLDTGAPSAINLFPSGWRKTGLWDNAKPFAPMRPGGIGGKGGIGRVVRAERVEFAGLTLDRPLIALDESASPATDAVDGLIGLPLIRCFNLATVPSRRTLWMARNAQALDVERRYGLAGLWLDRQGDGAVVAAVGTGSPAAGAGVAVGDRIAGDWSPTLRRIGGPPGTEVTLATTRRGTPRDVRFVLQPFL